MRGRFIAESSLRLGILVLLSGFSLAFGQTPQPMLPQAALPPVRPVTSAEYREHLQKLLALTSACQQNEHACDAKAVGDLDDQVQPLSGPAYIERYGWLRDLLEDRDDPDGKRRARLLPDASQRLTEELAAGTPEAMTGLTAAERSSRAAVLARKEFRNADTYSWSDRISAWFSEMMYRLFGGLSSLGRMAPWIGTALEWGTLIGAGAMLLFWIYRALDRQRVTIGRLSGDARQAQQRAESRAWADQARASAERGAWRDAVHALYWASIVLLEDRRTLRINATRTPREALRLIDAASSVRDPLQTQTAEFERIWYGLRPANATDYAAALQHYQVIESARQHTAASA